MTCLLPQIVTQAQNTQLSLGPMPSNNQQNHRPQSPSGAPALLLDSCCIHRPCTKHVSKHFDRPVNSVKTTANKLADVLWKVAFLTCSDVFLWAACPFAFISVLMCVSVCRVQYGGQHSVPVGHYLRLLLLLILGITSAALRWQRCWTPSLYSSLLLLLLLLSSLPPPPLLTSVPYPHIIFCSCCFPLSNLHPPCFWAHAW